MPYESYSKRQKRLVKAGEDDVYQYEDFPSEFRHQVIFIWKDAIGNSEVMQEIWTFIHDTLAEALGRKYLFEPTFAFDLDYDASSQSQLLCEKFLLSTDAQGVRDILELSFQVIQTEVDKKLQAAMYGRHGSWRKPDIKRHPEQAIQDLNYRFQEHNLGYEFVSGQIIRKDSQYIHHETVKPALALLADPAFSGPEQEFLNAHLHLRHGEYKDAILDANNAFESTMKTICGLRGWPCDAKLAAKALIALMFDNELIPRYLTSQMDHLRLVLETGLPTVRNKTSGHGDGSVPLAVSEYVASYALHIAAANIVLLVEAHKAKP